MNDLRIDALTGRHVIVAPGRRRIGATRAPGLPLSTKRCPFCPGHEADVEETVLALGEPWRVRVVKNRYPLLGSEGLPGAHEVIIEHPAHDLDLVDFETAHATLVLRAIRDRFAAHEATNGIESVLFFRNRGRRAGSSEPHPHGQITALGTVTPLARAIAARMQKTELSGILDREAREPVATEGPFVAFCPHASERAFHVRIASAERWPRFSALPDAALAPLAALLVGVAGAAVKASASSDYNLILHDPPVGVADAGFFFDLFPRTGGDAGFELGSGIAVCTVEPREATHALRAALLAEDAAHL